MHVEKSKFNVRLQNLSQEMYTIKYFFQIVLKLFFVTSILLLSTFFSSQRILKLFTTFITLKKKKWHFVLFFIFILCKSFKRLFIPAEKFSRRYNFIVDKTLSMHDSLSYLKRPVCASLFQCWFAKNVLILWSRILFAAPLSTSWKLMRWRANTHQRRRLLGVCFVAFSIWKRTLQLSKSFAIAWFFLSLRFT